MTPDTCTPLRARKNPPGQQRNQVGVSQCSNGNCEMDDNTSSNNGQVRKPTGWTKIDNAVLPVLAEIGSSAISVYVALKSHADQDGVCWPSIQAIATLSGASERTCHSYLAEMVQRGLLERQRRNFASGRTSNLYRFPQSPTATIAVGVQAQLQKQGSPTATIAVTPTATIAEEQDLVSEPYPENQTQGYSPGNVHLVGLVSAWNEMATKIGAPSVHSNPPPKSLVAVYKRLSKDADLREAFSDVPALMTAISKAKFCHGQGWFTLPWLFTTDPKTKELRVHKILNGAYSSNGNSKKCVSDERFGNDPAKPIAKTLGR